MGELGKRSGLAAALIAVMIAMAAMLSLAPQAHADLVAADSEGATSQYALLRSDSYLVPCDSSGVQLSDTWEGKRDSGTLDNVHTVYIASDVRIITQTHTVKYAEAYGGVDEFACTFTKAFSYNRGLPRLDEVKFLPNSRCATIGDDAFNGASYLTSVRLPNTVQRIGGRAFKDCTSLHDFSMGNSVLTIGVNAFGNCSNLTEIDLPATLTTISTNYQYGSFNGSGLKKVTVRATTPVSDGGDGRYICNAFGDTPIMQESNGAYIYVPTAALTTYRTHYGVGGSDGYGWSYFNSGHLDKLRGIDGEPASVASATVTLSATAYTYDGTAKRPGVTVKRGSTTLVNGTHYTVSYANNVNAGTASVTVTGKGLYTGTSTKTFTISPASISGAAVTGIADRTYNGGAQTQSPAVRVGSRTLAAGTNYALSYANNVNAGTATVYIAGKGNYTGATSRTFSIAKAKNTLKASGKTVSVSKKKTKKLSRSSVIKVSKAKGKVAYKKLSGSKKITVNAKTGKVTVKKGLKKGRTYKVKVRVTAKGNANYKSGSKTATFKVRVH